MKIVKLKGGLGNQMFQYSYALLLQKRTKEPVFLDCSSYDSLCESDSIRVPRITKFNISVTEASKEKIQSICKIKHTGNSQTFKYRLGIFAENILNHQYFWEPTRAYIEPSQIMDRAYFDGYWQSWRYVDEVKQKVLEEFTPNYILSVKTQIAIDEVQKQHSVFVGVRRGDYIDEAKHYGGFCSEYYRNAMTYIEKYVENPVFYIFSNDIQWCKENINWGDRNVRYRETEMQTDDFEELMIMASCKHAIIVNSTFNWWGAALIKNPKKIICCPSRWFLDDKPIDIIPNDWVRIENEV